MSGNGINIYEFEGFRLDVRERILSFDGKRLEIRDKAFDVLSALVARSGRLVTKDELFAEVWQDAIVEENTLDKNISMIRRKLCNRKADVKFIETVRGHGYRFAAEVSNGSGASVAETLSPAAAFDSEAAVESGHNGISRLFKESDDAQSADDASLSETHASRRYLRPILAAGLAVFVLGLAYVVYRAIRPGTPSEMTGVRKIAVLPLRNRTADAGAEYLSDGITEGIIDELSQFPGLKVMSRSSVFRFKNDQTSLSNVASQLGVDYVVAGDVKKVGDQLVIGVRLVNVGDGSQMWSDQFVKSSADILSAQDEITRDIAQKLRVSLRSDQLEAKKERHSPTSEAYKLYLLGRYHAYKTTEPELLTGISYFQKALDADPSYAMAYVGISECYRALGIAGGHLTSKDAMQRAKEAATKALELDPSLANAHASLAWPLYFHDHNWRDAEKEFRTAVESSPNDADIHRGLAHMLSLAGHHDEAILEGKRAVDLDPLALLTNALSAQFLCFAGKDKEAKEQVQRTFAIEPNFWIAHNTLGRILTAEGRYKEALSEFQLARDLSGGRSVVPIYEIGYINAVMGNRKAAMEIISELERSRDSRFVSNYSFAVIYNGLGDRDKALDYLERSCGDLEADVVFIKANHRWDAYKDDPRYIAILKQLNLE